MKARRRGGVRLDLSAREAAYIMAVMGRRVNWEAPGGAMAEEIYGALYDALYEFVGDDYHEFVDTLPYFDEPQGA